MTSVLPARRRAEVFAAALDGESATGTVRSAEISTLIQLVASLRAHELARPRDEFAAELRGRLMLEAETALRPAPAALLLPARPRGARERRLVAAASAFVLIGGTTTMAAAAQSALPGEALYPIKRGIEQAEVGLSMSAAGKGRDLLGQASDRLVEVEGLLASESVQSAPRVPETLVAFSESAEAGSSLLLESFRESGDREAVATVRTFANEAMVVLEDLAGEVPTEAQGELAEAALLLGDIDARATALCGSCAGDLPEVEVPGILLARAEVDRALALAANQELDNNHPVVVRRDRPARTREVVGVDLGIDTGATDTDTDTTDTTGSDGSTDAPAQPSDPLPSPTWEPESWPSLLPEITEGTSGGNEADEPRLAEGDLGSGLTGVVETLLPDVEDSSPDAGSLLD